MIALKVGDVIEVNEADYQYGTGKLILQITRIVGPVRAADGEWIDLEGVRLRADGTQLGHAPRPALVRVGTLRVRSDRGNAP